MRWLVLSLLLTAVALPARAQIPPEWQAAAQVVLGEFEQGTPMAASASNGNIEITLAEYLTFTALCRAPGCADHTIEGEPYKVVAQKVKALRAAQGGPYALAGNAHAWLASLADPTGAAQKNAALWGKDLDRAAADFADGNLYALTWILARSRPTPAEQATTFARFALFVQGRAWLGPRCVDITKVATVLDAPPRVEACR